MADRAAGAAGWQARYAASASPVRYFAAADVRLAAAKRTRGARDFAGGFDTKQRAVRAVDLGLTSPNFESSYAKCIAMAECKYLKRPP